MSNKLSYFKYVPNGFVHVWESAGWKATPALVDTHHGFYAILMKWEGEGIPVCPQIEEAA